VNVINQPPPSTSIQVLTGKQAGNTFAISKAIITIGRAQDNDIILENDTVSRYHARIIHDGAQWNIEKLALSNVVSINGQPIQQASIDDGDKIGFGMEVTVRFSTVAGIQIVSRSPRTERAPLGGSGAGIPSLEVSTNIFPDLQTYTLAQQVTTIGRDPSNDVIINAQVISAFHAQIIRNGSELILVHPHPRARGQKTLNGLLYEGRYIRGDEAFRKTLTRGDIFRIGDANGTLVTLTFNDGSGAPQLPVPQIRPIQLSAPVITIGRLPDNTVMLNHPQVSAHHARLELAQGGHRIADLGSTNHVYVNTQRVTHYLLKDGDEIRIGPFRLIYTGTELKQYDESKSIRIDALNLTKSGNKGVTLLNNISIAVPPRAFVALVGGSGAGKSTLLDALNGLRPAEGTVLYNGQDYYRDIAVFSTQLGYVPQDDIIHRDLTVEKALYYAAKLRLPDDFTASQIERRISEVLDDVDMRHQRHLLVSKLSGGQRKRVSIALELLANPSIFFLDEPTSGLDPGLDRKMMFLLRRLADKGRTIILVTHATNNINACDYVCFLAQGGRLAYFGPPNDAKVFFKKIDFAEIYGDLEPTDTNPNIPAEREEDFKRSPDYQKYINDPIKQTTHYLKAAQLVVRTSGPKRSKSWRQFAWLSMRYIELLKNDFGNLLILLLQAPIIGLIMLLFIHFGIDPGGFDPANVVQCPTTAQILTVDGLPDIPNPPKDAQFKSCSRVEDFLAHDPRGKAYAAKRGGERQALQDFILPGPGDGPKLLFIMAFAAVMFGCINAAREIVKEAPIYRRERAVNLGVIPYMFSKIVVLGVLCLLQSALLVIMVNWVDPFYQGIIFPALWEVYITLALTALAGLMLGLTVSAIVPNNDRAMSIVPIILIPQVIFSGTLFPLKGWFMQLVGALFTIRWSMAALGSSVGLHSDKLGGDTLFGNDYTYHGILFSTYSKTDATIHLLFIWLALAGMIVLLGWTTAYFLKRKDVRR
jgi:ABC transport system ATP-binding/permease protein